MIRLTTHVLNTATGKPAARMSILLEKRSESGWEKLAYGMTNDDGRMAELPEGLVQSKAAYRFIFETGAYFLAMEEISFYPQVTVEFYLIDESHYHVPLLISPYGYSTYRGS
jgi:5-hydroxyisourate hydrolase